MDLSDNEDLRWLSGLVRDLRAADPVLTPLLVGAMARDLLLHYLHAVPIARATADVDLAFAVSDWQEFDDLRTALIDSGLFTPGGAQHRLLYRGRIPIDLIPFGGVEAADGTITWPVDESVMGVLGFREALATATELILPESQRVLAVSLPMLAILKLLAWSARHVVAPRKDAGDLFLILKNYLNQDNTTRLYEEAAHLLQADDFDYEAAGGWLAGHDAASQIRACSAAPERLVTACQNILVIEADPNGRLQLVAESEVDVAAANGPSDNGFHRNRGSASKPNQSNYSTPKLNQPFCAKRNRRH